MAERIDRVTTFPPYKRHVATHNAGGKSVYLDCPPQQYVPMSASADSGFACTYSIAPVPAKLQNDQDLKAYMSVDAITSWSQPSVVMLNGANLLVTELGPGAMSPMHRTVSIDFSIVTNGEVDHELDGCETVQLRPGVCSVSA